MLHVLQYASSHVYRTSGKSCLTLRLHRSARRKANASEEAKAALKAEKPGFLSCDSRKPGGFRCPAGPPRLAWSGSPATGPALDETLSVAAPLPGA
ncbi:hypothetical protein NDU88_011937 [Pleurodeles waltl]|uniref:Uncharacterized protein n=1 Tax=Pleurodeles waltl TaxID=8319 RepID=A0AAV7S4Z9_PLEWA|nr:hypothetical protein NDU88_011937 [Pleurodeles waltl]